jgi:hypothetical protein
VGFKLSVLSALARMNVDPWEEAARLAAMPKTIAESSLTSTLDQVTDRNWTRSELEAIAGRLVQLLPRLGGDARSASIDAQERRGPPRVLVGVVRFCNNVIPSSSAPSSVNDGCWCRRV